MRHYPPFVTHGMEFRLVPADDDEIHRGYELVGAPEAAWLLRDLLPGWRDLGLDILRDGPRALVLVRRVESYGGAGVDARYELPLSSLSERQEKEREPEPEPVVDTWFEAMVVDGHGIPLAGIEVTLVHDGYRERLTTDGDGRVRLDGVATRSGALCIPDIEPLRDALSEIWARPSDTPLLAPGENLDVVYYRDAMMGPVSLRAEVPHTVSVQPFVVLGRMVGMYFDTNRSFLLPLGRPAIAEMRALYDRCVPCELLVVGHTDTAGEASYNEVLSKERADSVLAFLTDDVEAWLRNYESTSPKSRRWGSAEDLHMIRSMSDYATRQPGDNPVRWYQRTRGLAEDGDAGPDTRSTLIAEYMAHDGTTLPPDVRGRTHGCGEAFPLDESGEDLDEAPRDGADEPMDRRVELFFFGDSLGAGDDYRSWRRRAQQTYQQVLGPGALEIALQDPTGSAIPEARFTVELPVGAVIDGTLDANGLARIERVPPGLCRVHFPDLDRGFTIGSSAPLE